LADLPHVLTPSPDWRSDQFLVFDAVNNGSYMADVVCRFAQGEREMHVLLGLFPGVPTRLVVPLGYLGGEQVIPGRTPHRFKCFCSGQSVEPGRLTEVELSARTPGGRASVRISEPELRDAMPAEWPCADEPVVDDLHQWAQAGWPGKAASLAVISSRLTEELLATQMAAADDLSVWGGWSQRQFEGSGFVRTRRDGERWWLVDPDGYAFYSVGVDCVRPSASVETAGNEDLLPPLPARDGPYAHCWGEGASRERTSLFDAGSYNLSRALDERWFEEWMELSARRLRDWGFNTVGNWSDPRLCRSSGLPYVQQLYGFPRTEKMVFRDFPDVFSDEYERNSRRFAEQLQDVRGERSLIGYFLRNEPKWAFGDCNVAARMLADGVRSVSRDRFAEWLKERYGDMAALNAAWGSGFAGFSTVAEQPIQLDQLDGEAASADVREFNRLMIERYVRVPSEACRSADPDHLNLGLRYAWIAHDDLLAGGDAFDVFSINCYADQPPEDVIARCAEATGRPVMIGEFHTGALDRGLPMGGLRVVRTQQERADSYRYYVEQGATIPALVGTHYFQWNDQHAVGRYDGENWQIGMVDICQQPYEEFVAAARRTNGRIYRVASGDVTPFDRLPPRIEVS
jgi:hypothetical protein